MARVPRGEVGETHVVMTTTAEGAEGSVIAIGRHDGTRIGHRLTGSGHDHHDAGDDRQTYESGLLHMNHLLP